MFTPKPDDCPRPLQIMTGQKSTHMQFADGAQQMFQDAWLKSKASFRPNEQWTGQCNIRFFWPYMHDIWPLDLVPTSSTLSLPLPVGRCSLEVKTFGLITFGS